ncbi:hypothetical protein [Lysinibacillus xylanilyticus]|uniref:hypothetical protein n=1 Tax=Lysinibacillus xylanilyticus TaxID=582475 RepID=UPI003CFEA466
MIDKTKKIIFFSVGTLTLSTVYLFMSGHTKYLVPFLGISGSALVLFLLNEMKKNNNKPENKS